MRLLTSLLVLAAVASAQRWQVQRSRLATILFGISFVDESTGFVQGAQDGSGPMILRTIDGGASYQRSSISDGTAMFMAGAAQSRSNAVAGGVGLLTSGIQVTTDGQRFLNADIPVGMPPVGSTQSGAAVRRPGATLGAFGFVGQFTDGARAVTFTRDGGRTWSMHPVGEVPAPVRYGAYPTVDTWYVTGGTWPRRPTREEGSSIVDLTQKVTVNYANDTKRATVQYNMDDAEPTDEDKTGYTAYVLKTIDGGRTFQQVFYNTEGAYYFNGIDCADVNNCLAVAEGLTGARLFGTRDGGATWTERLFIPGRAASLFDVKYVSGGEVWACGGGMDSNFVGQFYHSRDNGMTWTANAVPGVYGTTLSFVTTPRGYVGWATALTIDGQSSTLIYQ